MSAKKLEQMRLEYWQKNVIERLTRLEDARVAAPTEKAFTREEVRALMIKAIDLWYRGTRISMGEAADEVLHGTFDEVTGRVLNESGR